MHTKLQAIIVNGNVQCMHEGQAFLKLNIIRSLTLSIQVFTSMNIISYKK